MFSELGVIKTGRSTELAASALWDLGLTEALTVTVCALMALMLLPSIFFRPLLLCYLARHMFLKNLGSTLLRDSYLCDWGFLMPFSELAVHGVF